MASSSPEGSVTRWLAPLDAGEEDHLLAQLFSREPTPDLAAQVAEEFQRLLSFLQEPGLAQVAQWRMEGYTVEEIAARLGCAPRSVKRKLGLIRAAWEKELVP